MPNVIEFWYEFASTYSYPAAMRVERVAAERSIRIAWKPFLLGPIFHDLGWSTSPFNLQPAKGAYMWRDMERICAEEGLGLSRPDPFPQNGLLAARVALALSDGPVRARFSRAVYEAQFAAGLNIADQTVIEGIVAQQGLVADEVLKRAGSDEIKTALRDQTQRARAHGIFGAPTWRTSDGEIFWGNDRLEGALDWQEKSGQ